MRVQRERVADVTANNKGFEVWAHLSGKVPVIEFERIDRGEAISKETTLQVRSLLAQVGYAKDIDAALSDAARGLRDLTNFDRVLVYQFDRDGVGEVKAEACGPYLESFLGLRFPAWDIPKQARAIMKRLPLRVIADVNAAPVGLHQLSPDLPPLDISLAASRGVSPIHMEYLSNMGLKGSMTLSIIVKGELWGLMAFHHSKPRIIGPNLRGAAELFIQFFCLQIEQRLDHLRNNARSNVLAHQAKLLENVDVAGNFVRLVEDLSGSLCSLIGADGMAIISDADTAVHGLTPPAEKVRKIADALLEPEVTLTDTDDLKSAGYDCLPVAGVLAMALDEEESNFALFFRKEANLSVTWAGAPKKDIVEDEKGVRLVPRGSFAAYTESVTGKSLPWEQEHLVLAKEIQMALTQANSALFRRLTHKSERQRSIYIAELNHRVRNILSLIRSLSRRTKASSESLETYAKALERRIAALGAAHDLATNQIINGIVINDIFKLEVKPFETPKHKVLRMTGARFVLRADVAPIFALIIHELTTNSVKHGALSVIDGYLDVEIHSVEGGVDVIWQERGGPPAIKPEKNGFGMGLIENAVPYELNGESDIEFRPDGLYARFFLPSEFIEPLNPDLQTNADDFIETDDDLLGVPQNVLILEDHMMLALDLADMLESLGVKATEKCANVPAAEKLLKSYSPDFALLDINIKDVQSFEIADSLMRKNIPFCFSTGYGSNYPIPDRFKGYPLLTKPIDIGLLKTIIEDVRK